MRGEEGAFQVREHQVQSAVRSRRDAHSQHPSDWAAVLTSTGTLGMVGNTGGEEIRCASLWVA